MARIARWALGSALGAAALLGLYASCSQEGQEPTPGQGTVYRGTSGARPRQRARAGTAQPDAATDAPLPGKAGSSGPAAVETPEQDEQLDQYQGFLRNGTFGPQQHIEYVTVRPFSDSRARQADVSWSDALGGSLRIQFQSRYGEADVKERWTAFKKKYEAENPDAPPGSAKEAFYTELKPASSVEAEIPLTLKLQRGDVVNVVWDGSLGEGAGIQFRIGPKTYEPRWATPGTHTETFIIEDDVTDQPLVVAGSEWAYAPGNESAPGSTVDIDSIGRVGNMRYALDAGRFDSIGYAEPSATLAVIEWALRTDDAALLEKSVTLDYQQQLGLPIAKDKIPGAGIVGGGRYRIISDEPFFRIQDAPPGTPDKDRMLIPIGRTLTIADKDKRDADQHFLRTEWTFPENAEVYKLGGAKE